MKNLLISKRLFDIITDFRETVKVGDKTASVGVSFDAEWYKHDGELHRSDTIVSINIKVGDKSPNCFDIRGNELSYFKGIQNINEHGKWGRDGRQIMKPSKFLKLIRSAITTTDEQLLNRTIELLATKIQPKPIKILVSYDVSGIYNTPTASRGTGTLGGSCMRYEAAGSYDGQQYVTSYDGLCKIAYALDANGNLMSRALLWEDVEDHDSGEIFKFMDRIYGSESSIRSMKEWAEYNGYFVKSEQTFSNNLLVNSNGDKHLDYHVDADIDEDSHEGMPYMDTLSRLHSHVLSTWNTMGISLSCTEGAWGNNRHTCDCCGEATREDELYYCEDTGDSRCDDCYRWSSIEEISVGNFTEIYINGDGWHYVSQRFINDPAEFDYICIGTEYYNIDETTSCECCGDAILLDDSMVSELHDETLCKSCFDDLHSECSECGDVKHNDELEENDGVCDNCKEE